MIAALTSKGQVTLPKAMRDQLELRAGDRLDFILRADGILEVIPLKQPVTKLKGILPKPKKAVSIDEMNQAIARRGQKR
ncbi:MAG: AbrB/MazE/SpoVT family DNA-binding domain-containing protein [Planctomycetota bacterium]|jgi:AbrB family looped-hinge helix DNA binding protein